MQKDINHFKVIGISHHLASVELREQFALVGDRISAIHSHLQKHERGGFVLSTCNRTEIYFICDNEKAVIELWADLVGVEPKLLQTYMYKHEGKAAINYLFRVGTGLDSQILGDFQIIGQIKQACQQSIRDGADNGKITRLIDILIKTSKRVKNETDLSSGVASMAYTAVQHIENHFQHMSKQTALVYGAGKMGTAVVRKLAEMMPTKQVLLANRTYDNAAIVAKRYQVQNVSKENLADLVDKSDFLVSTAMVDEPMFTEELLEDVDLNGKIFVDLSMPRSISPELAKRKGVQLINLDLLQDIQNETFAKRKESIPAAEGIVAEELGDFYNWMKQRDMTPTIHALKEKLHLVKDVEVSRLQKEHKTIEQKQIEAIAEALINKVTTQCVKHLKKHNGQSLDLIQNLFELDNVEECQH